jgi:hypothetical protein
VGHSDLEILVNLKFIFCVVVKDRARLVPMPRRLEGRCRLPDPYFECRFGVGQPAGYLRQPVFGTIIRLQARRYVWRALNKGFLK